MDEHVWYMDEYSITILIANIENDQKRDTI